MDVGDQHVIDSEVGEGEGQRRELRVGRTGQGGRVYGTFPNLALDSNDDVGRGGHLILTLSVDQMFADLLHWFWDTH